MKSKIALLVSLCLFTLTSSAQTSVTAYEACYRERAKNIPSVAEKEFLDAYMTYLKAGTKENGNAAIEKMKMLAKSQGGQFSIKWAGIFEGAIELCCGGPQTCTDSFGSMSSKVLKPRVEKGWVSALNLVLTYEKLAKTDGADAENLEQYLKIIRDKHPWAIQAFKKSNP